MRNFHSMDNRIVIKCANCHNKLRVPLDKGKISVSCPVCRNEFKYNPNSILDTLKQIMISAVSKLPKKHRKLYLFFITAAIVLVALLFLYFNLNRGRDIEQSPNPGVTVYSISQEYNV